jgi:hypothetical protein
MSLPQFNVGEKVCFTWGSDKCEGTIQKKIEKEEKAGNLLIFPSQLDPVFLVKDESKEKPIIQYASNLCHSGKGKQSKEDSAIAESSGAQFQQASLFKAGDCVTWQLSQHGDEGKIVRPVNDQEDFGDRFVALSKIDPLFLVDCAGKGMCCVVPASLLNKKQQQQFGSQQEGTGVQQGLGGSQGQTGMTGMAGGIGGQNLSQQEQGAQGQSTAKQIPIE